VNPSTCLQEVRGDDEIVDRVNYEVAVKNGEIEDDEDDTPDFTITEVIRLVETMERLTLIHGDPASSLHLTEGVRKFRFIYARRRTRTRHRQRWTCGVVSLIA